MDDQLLRVILYDNPWLEGANLRTWLRRLIPAAYVPRALRLTPGEHVCLVIGPRQVGKSTLIWSTLAEAGEPALLLSCEEPSIQEWLRSPAHFLADLDDLAPQVRALFFEEVQALEDAGRFLKGLVDRRSGRKLYATGSSSFHLEAATRESLAGRARRHVLLPLSLDELGAHTHAPPILARRHRQADLAQLLVRGSYPTVHTADTKEAELAHLVEAFVIRDASDRFRIRNVSAFRKLLRLLASQIGNLCNFSEWGALCGISNDTVADYAGLLEDTHIIRLVSPFVGGKRAELRKTPKIYFLDNGVRNVLFGGFTAYMERADRGVLMESFVFSELCRYTNPLLDSIRYWRSRAGAEVDFVLQHREARLAIEVKAGDVRGNLSRAARSFIDAYAPQTLLVVNTATAPDRGHGNTTIRFIHPIDLAEHLRSFLSAV